MLKLALDNSTKFGIVNYHRDGDDFRQRSLVETQTPHLLLYHKTLCCNAKKTKNRTYIKHPTLKVVSHGTRQRRAVKIVTEMERKVKGSGFI